jgi:hypothetical protein
LFEQQSRHSGRLVAQPGKPKRKSTAKEKRAHEAILHMHIRIAFRVFLLGSNANNRDKMPLYISSMLHMECENHT